MLAAKPILGWGLGTFPYIVSRFTTVALPYAAVTSNGANLTNIAHNYYLQLAAETGVVGLGLYLATMISFFVVGLRSLATLKDGTRKMVLIGVLAAMSGQVIDALTSPSYNVSSVNLFQWLLMGIGMFAAGVPVQTEEPVQEPVPATTGWNLRRAGAGFMAATVGVGFIGMVITTAGTDVADAYSHNGWTDTDTGIAVGVGAIGGYEWWLASKHGYGHHHDHDHDGSQNQGSQNQGDQNQGGQNQSGNH